MNEKALAAEANIVSQRPIRSKKRWYQHLYVQVLIAIMVGIVIGYVSPAFGAALKPLGDGFIKLVKMLIAPIIFCTVVHGIASMDDLEKVGRLGLKALVYFEVVTTVALIFGFVATHLWQPGIGMNIDPATLDPKSVQIYAEKAAHADST